MKVSRLRYPLLGSLGLCVAFASLVGCDDSKDDSNDNSSNGGMCMPVETPIDNASTTTCEPPPTVSENFGIAGQCTNRPATDYEHTMAVDDPRRTAPLPGGAPLWPACDVTDGREDWVLVGTKAPGAGPRTMAFDEIRNLLDYTKADAPTNKAFEDARDLYAVDGGIQSRVNRRPDYHFASYPLPAVIDANGEPNPEPNQVCQGGAIPSTCTAACAGPVKLRDPILNPAFCTGETSDSSSLRRIEAARIEAALLWFSYLSTYSEVHTTRGSSTADTDSALGYYTGFTDGITPATTAGLATYFNALDPYTHQRVWEGLRAVRCWRRLAGDQTPNLGAVTGSDSDLRWQYAINQLDRAMLHGVSLIVKDRLAKFEAESDAEIKTAHWAFIQALGEGLYRAAQATAPTQYDILKTELSKTDTNKVNTEAAMNAISATFPCP